MSVLKALFKISGGIHPPYRKTRTAGAAIRAMPLPPLLRVSMLQHLGAPAKPTVQKGDTVLRGQRIGEPGGFISAAVHAPTSGTVRAVDEFDTAAGMKALAVEIEPDGQDRWVDGITPHPDWAGMDPKALIARVAEAGIAGMGGAGFPTHVKLSPPAGKSINTLIVNGAECEPYLTADHRLMVERAPDIWTGIRILRRIVGAATVRVAIEDNKPDAIAALDRAIAAAPDGDAAVMVLPTAYPQGAEKQQIFAATGREVPAGGLPMDVGALVENVGTALAVWDAVVNGRPLTERVTTVTGTPVAEPANVLNRLGTPYADLLAFCGGATGKVGKVVSGGPMMGFAQHTLDVATIKTTSGFLVLAPAEIVEFSCAPCLSCGRCVAACPMRLTPADISLMIEAEDYEGAEALHVLDCIECGCCAFDCPARRPLVQHMKQGKARIMNKRRHKQQQEQQKAKS
jgi:electron transport complex protein RnfC